MSINFVRDTSGILFGGDSSTLSINNTAITDFKTYIDNQNNLKQNVITASNPLSLVSNTLSLNIDTTTLQIDSSSNKLKVIGGTGSSQWTTDPSNNIYYNNNIGIGQTNQNNSLLELYSTSQLLPRILLNGREFNSTNSNVDGFALLCGVNMKNNRQLWIGDSANLTKNSTNPIIRLAGTRIDCIGTDGVTYLKTTVGNSGGVILDGNTSIGTTDTSTYKLNVNGNININGGMYCNTSDNNVFVFDAIGTSTFGFVKKLSTFSRLVSITNPITLSTLTSGNLSQSVSGMTFKDILMANVDGSVSIPGGPILFSNNTTYAAPSLGINGGSGDRLVLAAGSSSAYPYAMGINGGTMWYSVPSGAVHKFYIAGSEIMNLNNSNINITGNILDILNTTPSSNFPFIKVRGGGGTGNTCGISFTPCYNRSRGYENVKIYAIDDGNVSAHLCIALANTGNGTQATERIRISNNGCIGIGTTSPVYTLDLLNTTGSANLPFIRLNGGGNAGNQVGIILNPFYNRTGGPSTQIWSIDDGNGSAHLLFGTAPTGGTTTLSERMRIQNNGSVVLTNSLSVGGNITSVGYVDCATVTISGITSNYNLNSVDASNLTNPYLCFKPNASNNDCCYVRQIGGDNQIRLAFDFYDDGDDARFVIRSIKSGVSPNVIAEVFSVTNGSGIIRNNLLVSSSDSTQYGGIKITTNDTVNPGYIEFYNVNSNRVGYIGYQSSNNSGFLLLENESTYLGYEVTGRLIVDGLATFKSDVNILGNFFINTLTVNSNFIVYDQITLNTSASAYASSTWVLSRFNINNKADSLVFCHNVPGNSSGYYYLSGTSLGTTYDISDERVKFNVEDIDNSSDKSMKLKPKQYNLSDDKNNRKCFGMIAQDVKKEFSEFVTEDPDYIANVLSNASIKEKL